VRSHGVHGVASIKDTTPALNSPRYGEIEITKIMIDTERGSFSTSGVTSLARQRRSGGGVRVSTKLAQSITPMKSNPSLKSFKLSTLSSLATAIVFLAMPETARCGTMFVTRPGSNTIGKYNATTGAPINPSLVSGLNHEDDGARTSEPFGIAVTTPSSVPDFGPGMFLVAVVFASLISIYRRTDRPV